MNYNHGKAKQIFDLEWQRLEKECRDAGMPEEAITQYYLLNKEIFNRDRAYGERKVSLHPDYFVEDEDDESKVVRKELTYCIEECKGFSRFWWLEEIENPIISLSLKSLTNKEIEMLTLLVFERFTQKEIAEQWGISPSAVCQRLKRIKQKFKR